MQEIVVISGKGGTGKTSVVSGLASLGPTKVLADCDVDAADLHLIMHPSVRKQNEFISGELARIDPEACTECGLCREYCRFGAIDESFRVWEQDCEGCALCSHVCPTGAIRMEPRFNGYWYVSRTRFGTMVHAALLPGAENSGKLVTTVRTEAREIAQQDGIDLILTDGSPGIGCPVIASLSRASLALIVAEPTLAAVSDLKRVQELVAYFGISAGIVLNKADINESLAQEVEAFAREKGLPVFGRIPYDGAMTRAQIEGRSITEYDPHGLGQYMHRIRDQIRETLQTDGQTHSA
ncbi:MAG: ATP-binding protein [Desulfohalobiaceae bacterium]|nr:ATP-binding protein [Desulfohalobiaceae bacterium]